MRASFSSEPSLAEYKKELNVRSSECGGKGEPEKFLLPRLATELLAESLFRSLQPSFRFPP